MDTENKMEIPGKENKNVWHESAKGVSVVTGVFIVVVLLLLAVNYLQIKLLDPLRVERLENMKIELLNQPKNEQMISDIRQLDLDIRKDTFRRFDFTKTGGVLLFGAVVVFILSLKFAELFKKIIPDMSQGVDQQERQIKQAMLARWGSLFVTALLVGGALLFAMSGEINFNDKPKAMFPSDEEIAANWPYFRGVGGGGVSAYTNVPAKWDGEKMEGVLWKSPIPLSGNNSPVVWDDRVFVTGASNEKRQVYCYDGVSGKLLWQRDVGNSSQEIDMDDGTGYAAPTAVTDGRGVYTIFPTGDIAGFNFEGKELWSRNLGIPDSMYGYASSLTMYQNRVIVQYDQATDDDDNSRSWIYALDTISGQPVWEKKRPVPASWTSPIVVKIDGKDQLVTAADPCVIAYDPQDGSMLWWADCLGTDVAPSPIYAGGLVFGIQPYSSLVAIDPSGHGDVTETHIKWTGDDNIPDICSPLSNGVFVFLLETYGTLTCYRVSDGEMLWEKDLGANFTSSPSLVGDKLYLLSEKGVMIIAEITGENAEYKELGRCPLGEKCVASPAFTDGRIYIRTEDNLYCIGENN